MAKLRATFVGHKPDPRLLDLLETVDEPAFQLDDRQLVTFLGRLQLSGYHSATFEFAQHGGLERNGIVLPAPVPAPGGQICPRCHGTGRI